MASVYSGFKYGGAALGSAGGVVTWSFATLAGQHYSFSSAITQAAYRAAIQAAFDLWESIANIDFQYDATDSNNNDIRLGWDTIDGASGTVGQAITYYSARADYDASQFSEIRFDTAENFAAGTDVSGINFYAVAVHEIGHALGLEHSTDPNSIMYPTVGATTLAESDIANIVALYGAAIVPVAPTEDADDLDGTAAADTIDGLGGDDIIYGLGGTDTLFGGLGLDSLYGGAGNDKLYGGDDADMLNGGTENDNLYGGNGDDALNGGTSGIDKLFGEGGNDYLNAGTSGDRLNGGDGNDQLRSGTGSDVFVFLAGGDDDIFLDFANGYDKIELTSYDFANFAAVKALATQVGTALVLDLGNDDSITINSFTLAQFTSGDVLL